MTKDISIPEAARIARCGADVDIDDLWLFATNEKLLQKAEEFLVNADEAALSTTLNRLQQDIALQIADRMGHLYVGDEPETDGTLSGMKAFMEVPNSDGSETTAPITMSLASGYELVTYGRVSLVIEAVALALQRHGAPCLSAFRDSVLIPYQEAIAGEAPADAPSAAPKLNC